MKKASRFYSMVILLMMTSCVYSLFPIYTKETLTYMTELEGKWQMDESEYIRFSPYGSGKEDIILNRKDSSGFHKNILAEEGGLFEIAENGYLMELVENKDTLQFHARLVVLNADYFLDLYPLDTEEGEYLERNFFPVHTFMKINIHNEQFELIQFDMDKLTKLFESNQIRLRHEKMDDGVIMITAQPKEIQKFLKAYSKDQSVFEKEEVYRKVS